MAFASAAAAYPVGDLVPWHEDTVMATGGPYAALELPIDGVRDIPVIPISLTSEALVIGVPAESVPWRPAGLIYLGDAVSRAPAADGQSTFAVVLVLNPEAAHSLVQSQGFRGWHVDGRWPSHGSFADLQDLPREIGVDDINLDEATAGPPPTALAVSPVELDHATSGGLTNGPWYGLVALPWPPPEPSSEPLPGAPDTAGKSAGQEEPEEGPGVADVPDTGGGVSEFLAGLEEMDGVEISDAEFLAAFGSGAVLGGGAEPGRRMPLLPEMISHGMRAAPLPPGRQPPLQPPPAAPTPRAPAGGVRGRRVGWAAENAAVGRSSPTQASAIAELTAQVRQLADGQAALQRLLVAQAAPRGSHEGGFAYERVPLGIGAIGSAGSGVFAGAAPPPPAAPRPLAATPVAQARQHAWATAQQQVGGDRRRMQEGGFAAAPGLGTRPAAGGGFWAPAPSASAAEHDERSQALAMSGPIERTLAKMADTHALLANLLHNKAEGDALGLNGGDGGGSGSAGPGVKGAVMALRNWERFFANPA